MAIVKGNWSLRRRETGDTTRCRIIGGTNLNVGVNEAGDVVDGSLWTNPSTAPRLWPEAYVSENSAPITTFKKIEWWIDSHKITNTAGTAIDTTGNIGGGLTAGQVFELIPGGGFSGNVMLKLKRECFGTIKDDRTIKFVGVVTKGGVDITLQATVSTSRYLVASSVYDANIISLDGSMFTNNISKLRFTPELRYGGVAVNSGVTFEWGWAVPSGSPQDSEGSDVVDAFQKIVAKPGEIEIEPSSNQITVYDEAILGNGAVLALRAKIGGQYVSYSYQPLIDVEDPISLQLSSSMPMGSVDVGPGINLTLSVKVMQNGTDISSKFSTKTWSWGVLKNPGANQELVPIGSLSQSGVNKRSVTWATDSLFEGSPDGPDVTLIIG